MILLTHFELFLDGEPQGCFMNGFHDVFPSEKADRWHETFCRYVQPPDIPLRTEPGDTPRFWFTRDGLLRCEKPLRDVYRNILKTGLWTVGIRIAKLFDAHVQQAALYGDPYQIVLPDSAVNQAYASDYRELIHPDDFDVWVTPILQNKEPEICPSCGLFYTDHPAASRKLASRWICPECGIREALECSDTDENTIQDILDKVQNARRSIAVSKKGDIS